MTVSYVGVNAFATQAFRGNPAVVCLLGEPAAEPEPAWMGRVAAEFNQPATAFVWTDRHGYRLRWFTAAAELPMCGHGTLATAHVLYETGRVQPGETVRFRSESATLAAHRDEGRIWMELPGAELAEGEVPEPVLSALGLPGLGSAGPDAAAAAVEWFGHNEFEYVLRVADPALVEEAVPDPAAIRALPVTRVCLTAPGGAGADFTSRVFPPKLGLDEDQVTGSAHAVLGQLWAGWLGRAELTARQASARGGELALVVGAETVRVGGPAVTVSRGELLV